MKQAVVVKTQERYRIKGSRRRERQLREKYIGRKAREKLPLSKKTVVKQARNCGNRKDQRPNM